jgi:hypothetical protein
MTNTLHGHHIPRTNFVKFKGDVAKCGGVMTCTDCWEEALKHAEPNQEPYAPSKVPEDRMEKVKKVLVDYVDSQYSESFEKPAFEVRIVWFAKVLQNWKALVITDRPDGKYYELTYNGDKHETYVDEYVKVRNTVVSD